MAKILFIDDSDEILQMAKKYLEGTNHEVVVFKESFAAFDHLNKNPQDLIVTDINMPHKSGLSFVSEIKKSSAFKDLPVIFMSARNTAQDITRAAQAGGSDYLIKPITKETLIEKINKVLTSSPKPKIREVRLQTNTDKTKAKLFVEKTAEIIGITETGIRACLATEMFPGAIAKIFCPIFNEIGITPLGFEVKTCKPIEKGKFECILEFKGFQGPDDKSKLEKWINGSIAVAA